MIRTLNNRFLRVNYHYDSPITQQRASNLLRMNFGLFVITALLLFFLLVQAISGVQFFNLSLLNDASIYASLVLFFIVYQLIQRGRLQFAQGLFVGFLVVAILVPMISTDYILTYAGPPILLVAAGLLLQRRGFIMVMGAVALSTVLHYLYLAGLTTPVSYIPAETAMTGVVLGSMINAMIVLFLLAFSGSAERVVNESLKDIKQLGSINHFTDTLGEVPLESTIYTRVLEVAQKELGYELSQLYLPDNQEGFSRQLRLSFGGAPRRLTLSESDQSVFTEAMRTRQPVLVSWRENSFRTEHLIPPARQSCTVVMVERDTVIALLDVQTSRETALTAAETTALTSLVRQAARELEYGRSIRDLQNTVREQETVINRFTRQLSEIRGTGREASAVGWSRYFEGRGGDTFGFDLANDNGKLIPVSSSELPDLIRETILRGDVHVQRSEREQVVTVPILFRDFVLGAISFNVPPERPVNDRQIELIRTVADRLSVALENNRLLEQTQAQARRERQASEIGSVLLSATNVESVLALAADNFNEALGAVHTRVYLQPGALIKSGEAT